MRLADALDITLGRPVAVVVGAVDRLMVTTAARNAASALADGQSRRQQWVREERDLMHEPTWGQSA